MKRSQALNRAGVTLTELLVVLVIVSILATIAVPVYINKAENARIASAQAECKLLAEAEDTCAMHHGFYVPLQLLDDQPAHVTSFTDDDVIDRESKSIYLIDPSRPIDSLDINQRTLDPAMPAPYDPRVDRLIKKWEGPFITIHRPFIGNASADDPALLGGNLKQLDYPLDPWGQPYRFYAPYPYGLIGTSAWNSDPTQWRSVNFSDGKIIRNNKPQYDRFVIVSYGPNGIPNDDTTDPTSTKDDIVYYFGRIVSPSTYDGVSSATATVTATATPTATP